LRKPQAAQQVLVARVSPQRVEHGFPSHDNKSLFVLLIGFFQASESLILFIQPRVDCCDVKPGDVHLLRPLLQLLQHPECFRALARARVGVSETALVVVDVGGQGCGPLKFHDRLFKGSLSQLRQSEVEVRVSKIRVDLEALPQLFDGQIILSCRPKSVCIHCIDDERERVELLGLPNLGKSFLVSA
jgi:hypothetical protein